MKRFRLAIILAVVLLALGGLATWDEWQTKKDDEAKKTENRLTDVKVADVVEMRFESRGGEGAPAAEGEDMPAPTAPIKAMATKKDGVWHLVEPLATLGDTASIDNLLTTVLDYSYAKVVSEDRAKWPDYGLLEPQRTISFKTGGDKPTELTVYVGSKAPVGYNVYLRTSRDDRVFVGSQHLLASTSKSLFELRDKSVAKFDPKIVRQLTYTHIGEPTIEMSKDGDNWAISKPEGIAADSAEIRDFVEELARIKATAFIDQTTAINPDKTVAPTFDIRWADDKGDLTTLLINERGGKLYANTPQGQTVAELGDEWKGKLTKTLNDFRYRRIFSPTEMDAKSLAIDGDRYERVGGDWYLPADATKFDEGGKPKDPNDKPKDVAHLRAFLVDLEFAKTDDFLPLDGVLAAKLAAPLHRITITPKAGPEIVVDVFTDAEKDDRYLVRRTGGTHLFRLSKSAFNSMTPPPAGVKEAEPSADDAPGLEDEGLNLEDLGEGDEPEGAG